jgi:hypothetical protein
MYVIDMLHDGSETAEFRDLELLVDPVRESTIIPASCTGHSYAVGKEVAFSGTYGARLRQYTITNVSPHGEVGTHARGRMRSVLDRKDLNQLGANRGWHEGTDDSLLWCRL